MWLLRRHISIARPSSKLDVRRLGPFVIIDQIGSSAFHLDLSPSMQIYLVFHVSLLEPHVPNTFSGRVVDIPLPIHVEGLPEFEVQSVLDSKIRWGKLSYFIVSERSRKLANNLTNAQSAIKDFHIKFPLKPRYLVSIS